MHARQGVCRALVALVALSAVVGARSASAQEAPKTAARLTWDAPPSCPTSEDVEARIKARTPNPPRSVTVQVVPDSDQAAPPGQVRVTMSTDGAERSFVAPSCEEAATAVAVIVALAASRAEPPPEPQEKPQPPPPPTQEKPQPPPPTTAWTWTIGAGGAIDTGSLPSLAPGVAIGVEARAPRTFVLGLEIAGFMPETERGNRPAEATIALIDVLPRGCALLPLDAAVRGGTCVGAGVGILPGESANVTQPRSAIGFRPEAVWLARLEANLSAWASVRVEGGALMDPVRPPFRIDPWGEVYRPPLLTARMTAMVDFRFR